MKWAAVGAVLAALAAATTGASGTPAGGTGRIAFSLDRNGISRMYTVRPDGTRLRLLTLPPTRQLLGGDSGPVWSPDGGRIVFERDLPYWGDDRFALYVIRANGGHARALTNGPFDVMPAWSPDGGRVAFVRLTRTGSSGTTAIDTIDTSNGEITQLTDGPLDLTPAWSPDGRTIVFSRIPSGTTDIEQAQLFLVDADGSHLRPLGTKPILGISPEWSPDGKRIAFVSFADHNGRSCAGDCVPAGEIYTVSADGTTLTRLTRSKVDDEDPTWSPDGTRIAFSSGTELGRIGHAPWLVVVPAAGGRTTRIGRLSGVRDPSWSPR